jgi:hypothetical protein
LEENELMSKSIVMFTPQTIIAALERITNEEAFELDTYASQGEPSEFCERATAWLVERGFSGRAVIVIPGKAEN